MSETKNTKASEKALKAADKSAKVAEKAEKAKKQPAVKKTDKDEFVSAPVNALIWTVSLILICGAIFGNYYYTQYVVIDESTFGRLGRVAAVIAVIAAGLILLVFSNKGHKLLDFAHKSYIELRKVVWPTRQEAVQTTFIVFVAVCVVSLFLYLCDVIFLQIIKVITL